MRLCHGGTNEPDLMGGTNGVMQTHDNTAIKRSSHERHSDIVNTARVFGVLAHVQGLHQGQRYW